MKTTKILTEDISDITVSSLPTRPTSPVALGGRGYSPSEMKAAFDKLPLYVIERFNSLIDDIRGENGGSIADAVKTGITFGSALAMVISYVNWHSVGWAIVHGLMGWVYVVYYVLRY